MNNYIQKKIISYLSKKTNDYVTPQKSGFDKMMEVIQTGDVILVEGKQRFSKAIKYITQSNWSHSAMYIGSGQIIEADMKNGVQIIPLKDYINYHTRICRPKHILEADMSVLLEFLKSKIGSSYDTKHISDLLKIAINPNSKLRKVLIKLGSSDPKKVICSSLITDGFQRINYPIIPVRQELGGYQKINPTVITPSDFDLSPYFNIIKPTLKDFNYTDFFLN